MTMLTMSGRLRFRAPSALPSIETASGSVANTRQQAAFARLWEAERERVWRLTARLSGSADQADDLTQEVALRALAAWPEFRGQASASTWLHRIAVNVTLRWRETRREQASSDFEDLLAHVPDGTRSPEQAALWTDETTRTRAALDRLPEMLRVPLVLQVWEDLKYREIADLLEIPQGTVMSRLNSARKQLREMLEEKGTDHAL